jgi:hypothetical protein
MRLRRFNVTGVERFRAQLAVLRQDPKSPVDTTILEDNALTEQAMPAVDVARPGFVTKREAADYLDPKLSALRGRGLFDDVGLWSWLAMFYLDDVVPPRSKGRRALADPHYILDVDYKRRYRHLLATPVRVRREIPNNNSLFLDAPLNQHGEIMEQLVSRLYVMRIPAVAEALELLYFDQTARKPKRGIVPTQEQAGDLRNRFPARLRQLSLTYDLGELNGPQLVQLLGREFERWQR